MKTDELNYELPERLIAQRPGNARGQARLLVVDRGSGTFKEDRFYNIAQHLRKGDCLVLNDTRVIPARLYGNKESGGRVEVFLLREHEPGVWEALVRPSAKVKPGTYINVGEHRACVEEILPGGKRRVRFDEKDVLRVLEQSGHVPLPPYIHRDAAQQRDRTDYQTIFANAPGAVAAPTAGLHYTDAIFDSLKQAGVDLAFLTLHVGYGTFKPVTSDTLEDHHVDVEDFEFTEKTATQLNQTRASGGRIVAVGTTAARVLETQCNAGNFAPGAGETSTYIHPPYTFTGVDILQTNFHLPRSSLLALVCAFAGTELILDAYHHAIDQEFTFYSYGDTMLIR